MTSCCWDSPSFLFSFSSPNLISFYSGIHRRYSSWVFLAVLYRRLFFHWISGFRNPFLVSRVNSVPFLLCNEDLCPQRIAYVASLTPNVMALRGRALLGWTRHWEQNSELEWGPYRHRPSPGSTHNLLVPWSFSFPPPSLRGMNWLLLLNNLTYGIFLTAAPRYWNNLLVASTAWKQTR